MYILTNNRPNELMAYTHSKLCALIVNKLEPMIISLHELR